MYEFFLRIHSIKVRKLFLFLVMNLIFSSMEHFIYCQLFLCFSDRLVRLWRVTGTLEEQLNELDRSVDV